MRSIVTRFHQNLKSLHILNKLHINSVASLLLWILIRIIECSNNKSCSSLHVLLPSILFKKYSTLGRSLLNQIKFVLNWENKFKYCGTQMSFLSLSLLPLFHVAATRLPHPLGECRCCHGRVLVLSAFCPPPSPLSFLIGPAIHAA
jgi:hypothetical protein